MVTPLGAQVGGRKQSIVTLAGQAAPLAPPAPAAGGVVTSQPAAHPGAGGHRPSLNIVIPERRRMSVVNNFVASVSIYFLVTRQGLLVLIRYDCSID